jgi:uncharacterized LabA/DUF88 family protein
MLLSQRIAILVDSENLEIAVSKNYEPHGPNKATHVVYPDWMKIIPSVTAKRALVRNIYYKKKEKNISKKFRTLWQNELHGEIKQPVKSVDPYIIVDAISLAEKADTIVILAGDKDYLPLLWYLKSKGCKVEIASFESSVASVIKATADHFHLLKTEHTVVLRKGSSA